MTGPLRSRRVGSWWLSGEPPILGSPLTEGSCLVPGQTLPRGRPTPSILSTRGAGKGHPGATTPSRVGRDLRCVGCAPPAPRHLPLPSPTSFSFPTAVGPKGAPCERPCMIISMKSSPQNTPKPRPEGRRGGTAPESSHELSWSGRAQGVISIHLLTFLDFCS